MSPTLHATVVARYRRGAWRGVMVRGASGAGKSDLAIRLAAADWRLVADDRAIAWASGGRLYARAPERLHGLVEARALGVLPIPALDWAEVALVVDLVGDPEALERVPAPAGATIAGLNLPLIQLYAQESSAPAKLALALEAATLGWRVERAYQDRSADEARGPGVAPGASQEE